MAAEKDDAPEKKPEPDHDVVLVHGRTEDGQGLRALRSRPDRLDLAELRPLRSGQPIQGAGEVVRLRQRGESPLLYDVDVQYHGEEQGGTGGPPQVATQRYRDNWEAIFGKKRRGVAN